MVTNGCITFERTLLHLMVFVRFKWHHPKWKQVMYSNGVTRGTCFCKKDDTFALMTQPRYMASNVFHHCSNLNIERYYLLFFGHLYSVMYISYILKQTWCLYVCSSQTFTDCGQGSRCRGPGEVPRPFIHPMWMRGVVWGQMVHSTGQMGVHRARCHSLLYIQCGCVMQFGAKWCAQWAKWGCTRHDATAFYTSNVDA